MKLINPASSLLAFTVACMGAAAIIECDACKPAEAPGIIEAGAPVAQDACVKLSALDSSGVLQEVCALLPDILAVAAIVVPLVMVSKGEACQTLVVDPRGGTMCLTNGQRLQIINRLKAKDAGR